MINKRLPDSKRFITIGFFLVTFVLLVIVFYQGCYKLSILEAEKNISNFLLNHKAIHRFVNETQRPEVYRLKNEGKLDKEYFSPILLSRTYIARNIKDALNEERIKVDLESVNFKLAAKNPRNVINTADEQDLEILAKFNTGARKEYKQILHTDTGKFLFYAIPVNPNSASCLQCHGDPKDAPKEMVRQYGNKAGFHEAVGDIRALISVKVPLNDLLSRAHATTWTLSAITFVLLSGFLVIVLFFFEKIDVQKRIADEKSFYLDSVLKSSRDTAIIVTNKEDVIIYFNDEAERLLGVSSADVINHNLKKIHRFFGNMSAERFENKLENIRKHGSYHFNVNPEEREIDVRISAISDAGGEHRGFLFIGHDITEQVQAKQEQEAIKARLQKAEKMESIGLMAGGVAHDLNNILTSITSYPDLMLLKLPQDSKLRAPLSAIQEAGMRAAGVVDDLLTVARGTKILKEIINPNDLIEKYLQSPEHRMVQTRHEGIEWKLETDPKLKNVRCSPTHLNKCLMNLVGNAAESISQSGVCNIQTQAAVVESSAAKVLGINPGEYSIVSIKDNGKGIPEEDIEHIFEPFYTTKKMGSSGTGLGLTVVWNTMLDHDGTVKVKSSKDGTVFDLYFPVTSLKPELNDTKESFEELQGNNELILVVDDEPHLREIAGQNLIALGYRVESVTSGEQAVQFLMKNRVDLVLLDMLMEPGIDGYETYKRIIKVNPRQKAVIVSGYSKSKEVKKAEQLGVGAFIKKPYTITQLGKVIKEQLAK